MNVNLRPDMLRQPGLAQPPMMSLNSGPFMQSAGPPGPPPPQMGLPPNAVPPMGMLPGPPNGSHGMPSQHRYQLAMQQQHPQGPPGPQRPMMMRPAPGQPMNPAANGGHMPMGFPPTHAMHQGGSLAARRGVPQGHLNSGAPHMPANPMQQMALGPGPQPPMRPPPQMGGQPMRTVSAGHMSPDMQMGLPRQGPASQGMPPPISRGGSAPMPLMNGIGPSPPHQQPHFASPGPHMSASPRPPSHPSGPGPSSRTQDNPMEFLQESFPGQSFSSQPPSNGTNYPFVPSSSTPPSQMAPSMSRPMPPNTPRSGPFQLTPAQQFEQMQQQQQQNADNYANFNMPPPRPPSHNHHRGTPLQQQQQQSHPHSHSPHLPQDPINSYPQPHSRPQSTTGRPPSSLEQRQPLPPNPSLGPAPAQVRLQPQHSGPQPGHPLAMPGPPHSMSAPPNPQRPPNQPPNAFGHGGSPASSSTMSSSDQQASTSGPRGINLAPPSGPPNNVIGNGQGIMRLLQFSGNLASETIVTKKLQLSWWGDLIKEYFSPKAIMKITLWKDNQRTEAKPFEIGVPILPRFFLVTTQSGVQSMTLTLDGARERFYSQGHSVVECVHAVWTYKYKNGYTVTLKGPLTVHIIITANTAAGSAAHQGYVLKFEDFQFDANNHDKYISVDSIARGPPPAGVSSESPKTPRSRATPGPGSSSNGIQAQDEEDKKYDEPRIAIERGSMPGEPVNAFGIPQATMRCLELAESVAQMTDLIGYASEANLGPIEALSQYATKLRETHPLPQGAQGINGASHMPSNGMLPYHYAPFQGANMGAATTLYSSAPPSVTNPGGGPSQHPHSLLQSHTPSAAAMSSPQNPPSSAHNSPQKAHKTIPQHPSQNAPSTTSSSTPTSTVNTPALATTTLKRKVDTTSPTTAEAAPPPKRATRKRRATGAGGG